MRIEWWPGLSPRRALRRSLGRDRGVSSEGATFRIADRLAHETPSRTFPAHTPEFSTCAPLFQTLDLQRFKPMEITVVCQNLRNLTMVATFGANVLFDLRSRFVVWIVAINPGVGDGAGETTDEEGEAGGAVTSSRSKSEPVDIAAGPDFVVLYCCPRKTPMNPIPSAVPPRVPATCDGCVNALSFSENSPPHLP